MGTKTTNGMFRIPASIKRGMRTKSAIVVVRTVGVRVPIITPRTKAVTDVSITMNSTIRSKTMLTALG